MSFEETIYHSDDMLIGSGEFFIVRTNYYRPNDILIRLDDKIIRPEDIIIRPDDI